MSYFDDKCTRVNLMERPFSVYFIYVFSEGTVYFVIGCDILQDKRKKKDILWDFFPSLFLNLIINLV